MYSNIIIFIFLANEILSLGAFKGLTYMIAKDSSIKNSLIKFFQKRFALPISFINFLIILIFYFFFDSNLKYGFLIFSLYIPFYYFFHIGSHVLHGINDFKNWNIIRLVQSFLWLVIIFIIIGFKTNIKFTDILFVQIIVHCISSIIFFLVAWLKKLPLQSQFSNKKEFIGYSLRNYKLNISMYIYSNMDLIIISLFMSAKTLGLYAVGKNISALAIPLFTSYCEKIFQRSINNYSEKYFINSLIQLVFLSLTGVITFLIFGEKILLFIYSKEYDGLYNIIKFLIFLSISHGFNLFLADLLRAKNYFDFITIIYFIAILINLILFKVLSLNYFEITIMITISNLIILLLGLIYFLKWQKK